MKLNKKLIAVLLVLCLGAGVVVGVVGNNVYAAKTEEEKKAEDEKKVADWKAAAKESKSGYTHGIEVRPGYDQSIYNKAVDEDHAIRSGMIRYKTFIVKK
ncbi:MAG: hypothetical protein IJT05_04055 [Lachnospiraceae bacterium]|nr:hypothetical protein [Lachnospiraceae bacterium]